MAIRTTADAGFVATVVTDAVRAADPALRVTRVAAYADYLRVPLARPRFATPLLDGVRRRALAATWLPARRATRVGPDRGAPGRVTRCRLSEAGLLCSVETRPDPASCGVPVANVHRVCASCGRTNRVPAGRLASEARCGACKAPIPPVAEPLDADPELFDAVTGEAPVPVLVDFWAAWCGPCRMAAPEVAAVAAETAGRALVLKVDTERHPELAARYGVRGIPNFVVLRGGSPVHQQAGVVDRGTLRRWLDAAR